MRSSKKARPDAATSRQAKQGNHQTSGNPYEKFNTGAARGQFKIEALLMIGKENGLRLADLVRLLDQPERDVRREIQSTPEDRAKCVQSLRGRAKEILDVADAIERAGVTKWQMP